VKLFKQKLYSTYTPKWKIGTSVGVHTKCGCSIIRHEQHNTVVKHSLRSQGWHYFANRLVQLWHHCCQQKTYTYISICNKTWIHLPSGFWSL